MSRAEHGNPLDLAVFVAPNDTDRADGDRQVRRDVERQLAPPGVRRLEHGEGFGHERLHRLVVDEIREVAALPDAAQLAQDVACGGVDVEDLAARTPHRDIVRSGVEHVGQSIRGLPSFEFGGDVFESDDGTEDHGRTRAGVARTLDLRHDFDAQPRAHSPCQLERRGGRTLAPLERVEHHGVELGPMIFMGLVPPFETGVKIGSLDEQRPRHRVAEHRAPSPVEHDDADRGGVGERLELALRLTDRRQHLTAVEIAHLHDDALEIGIVDPTHAGDLDRLPHVIVLWRPRPHGVPRRIGGIGQAAGERLQRVGKVLGMDPLHRIDPERLRPAAHSGRQPLGLPGHETVAVEQQGGVGDRIDDRAQESLFVALAPALRSVFIFAIRHPTVVPCAYPSSHTARSRPRSSRSIRPRSGHELLFSQLTESPAHRLAVHSRPRSQVVVAQGDRGPALDGHPISVGEIDETRRDPFDGRAGPVARLVVVGGSQPVRQDAEQRDGEGGCALDEVHERGGRHRDERHVVERQRAGRSREPVDRGQFPEQLARLFVADRDFAAVAGREDEFQASPHHAVDVAGRITFEEHDLTLGVLAQGARAGRRTPRARAP